ncbi:hypothetical protein [Terrimonas alba]|uniref:hypothetical protein n=1 Tax=Terrimonas alba TaxID=3349636 RepID=UPI0036DE6C68
MIKLIKIGFFIRVVGEDPSLASCFALPAMTLIRKTATAYFFRRTPARAKYTAQLLQVE